MMFPDWVDAPTESLERAANRLRYLIGTAAIQLTGKNSVRALARGAGIDHSVIAYSIKRGHFSAESAVRLEDFVGRSFLPNEYLRHPLEIQSESL